MATHLVNPQFVIDAKGHKKSVLLDVADYERLMQRLEDLEDALALDEARHAARGFRDYTDVRAELRKAKRL